jgi:hypothetical protein
MSCEVPSCNLPVFAACACTNCASNGPLLCYDHFQDNACKLVDNSATPGLTISEDRKEAMKKKFVENFDTGAQRNNSVMLTEDQWKKMMEEVEAAEGAVKKTIAQYGLARKFLLIKRSDGSTLLGRRKYDKQNNPVAPVIALSLPQAFDAIFHVHQSTIHGGIGIMLSSLRKQYWNVTQEQVAYFKKICEICASKAKLSCTNVVVKPVRSHRFGCRGQVDLVDLQSVKHNGFNWVLQYQDHFTKFSVLRALKTKRAAEVAHTLMSIFCLIGPPNILQSDNGKEFVNQILLEFKVIWPSIVIINGRPRHPQSQGSVERANQDVKTMLSSWCEENKTKDWTAGLHFVQLAKNCRAHSTLAKSSPYEAVYFRSCEFGIAVSELPASLRNALVSGEVINEEDISAEGQNAEEDEASDVTLLPDAQRQLIASERQVAVEEIDQRQQIQADRMVQRGKDAFPDPHVDDNVALAVDKVDRGPLDARSITCVVLRVTDKGFELGCKAGRFSMLFQKNSFLPLSEKLLRAENVPETVIESVRTAVQQLSTFGGQGFIRCSCIATKCKNNKCKCRSAKVACNSRCHPGRSCCNDCQTEES